jgi:hypothetical protein
MLELGYADANGVTRVGKICRAPGDKHRAAMRSATIGVSRRFIGCIPVRGSGGR